MYKPKILCLNETKISEPETSLSEYFGDSNARLQFAYCSSRKNYSGVAILYDASYIGTHLSMQVGMGDDELDSEGRVLTLEFDTFTLVSVYTPHSGVAELKRLEFRVNVWDRAFE